MGLANLIKALAGGGKTTSLPLVYTLEDFVMYFRRQVGKTEVLKSRFLENKWCHSAYGANFVKSLEFLNVRVDTNET